MDLGSLELQIFVSLTVVLGAAFVALVCDYLKGNNEQLREHNIELRVRKEEQERHLLLDPAGYLAQQQVKPAVPSVQMPIAARAPVAAHDVMRSHAAQADLAAAEARAEALQNRTLDRSDVADVPDMAPKRSRRSRRYADAQPKPLGESFGDWVRPEVIARVARKADATASYQSDIREEIAAPKEESRPQPLNAADKWDIRDKIAPQARTAEPQPVVEAPEPAVETAPPPVEAVELQKEIERVAQMERVAAPAPASNPGVVLRPLVIPSLSLEEELERLADTEETPLAKSGPMHSALLEQVIAASSGRGEPVADAIAAIEPDAVIVEPAEVPAPVVEFSDALVGSSSDALVEPVSIEPVVAQVEFAEALPEPVAEVVPEPPAVIAVPEPVFAHVEFAEALPEPVAEVVPEPPAVIAALEPVFAGVEFAEAIIEPIAELPAFEELPQPEASALPEAAEPLGPPIQGPVSHFGLVAAPSFLAGLGVPAVAEPVAAHVAVEFPAAVTVPDADPVLSPVVEEPEFVSQSSEIDSVELLPAYAELAQTEIDLLPVEPELPVEVSVFASETLAESLQDAAPEPPPIWSEPAAPIDINSLRQPEPVPQGPLPDVELPAGMFDDAMWVRLLTLPNPMSGILFTITLTKAEAVPGTDTAKKSKEIEDLTPALEKLMTSFVRGNDFGSRIGENEWVFVYSHDTTGFNQRRVGGISEKLWDFQLRHLGMSTVSFKWGAVEVQSERLADALEAARERMNQAPRRRSKLPGSDYAGPRQVVNA